MVFKLDIGTKQGKTYHYEISDEKIKAKLIGKKIGDIIKGEIISKDFIGYEFEITGLSDIRGFPGLKNIEGQGIKRVLLSYGVGMRQRRPKGLRRKKTVHGNEIGRDVVQINLKVIKEGEKKLEDLIKKTE
ncbi:MAG: S6e family ribosomal protein [Candidatus Pacearchaeota archaeon]